MPRKKQITLSKQELRVSLNEEQEKALIYFYSEGWDVIELEKTFGIDQNMIFRYIRKQRYKQSELDIIYEKQENRRERFVRIKDLQNEKILSKERFFPCTTDEISYWYYNYWNKKFLKSEKEKERCQHEFKHIKCAKCNKILGDASNL